MPTPLPATVEPAQQAARRLAVQISGDLDDHSGVGGITWWQGYGLDPDQAADMADYLISVAATVPSALERLSWVHREFLETCTAEDFWYAQRMRAAGQGRPNMIRTSSVDQRRETRRDVHIAGFFIGAASLMDILAGLAVGILGLRTSLRRADAAFLDLGDLTPSYPRSLAKSKMTKSLLPDRAPGAVLQVRTLRSIRTSISQAGPRDWWPWADAMRNVLAHQGQRLIFHVIPKSTKGSLPSFSTLSPRQPRLLDSIGLRDTDGLHERFLMEDSRETLTGLLGSLNAATVGICDALSSAWIERRADPALITQPADQAPIAPPVIDFPGYAPDSVQMQKGAEIMVGPATGRRLRAGRLLDRDKNSDGG